MAIGDSALIQAIYDDKFLEAKKLINENKDDIINVPNRKGKYPIHLVTDISTYEDITEETVAKLHNLAISLVKNGAKVNIFSEGMLPIHYAAYNGNLEVFKAVYQANKILLYAADLAKQTPLNYAKQKGHTQIEEFILSVKLIPSIEPGDDSSRKPKRQGFKCG